MPNPMDPEVPPPGAGVATVICAVPAAATSAAEMAAVSCVALRNVVVRAAPFQRTVEPLTKPLPFTRSVSGPVPAVTPVGVSPVSPGTGLFTVNVRAPEVPPPGAGVITVTCGVPAAATSAAAMAAVSCVALTKTVVRAAPFQLTVEPPTKLLPVTVSVKPALPADVLVGDRAARVGDELFTVNVCAAEVPPPGAGVTTVTDAVVAAARSVAGIAAVSWVALTNVVVRVAPFQRTLEPVTKLLPFRVRVKAAPVTLALEGESDVSDGAGAVIVNVWAPEVPPSTPGIVTVTWAVPTAAMSEAGIAAVTCVGLTRVVVRAAPFQPTLAPMSNPVPVSVSVNPAPPAVALEGDSVVSVGPPALTGRLSAAEVPPPGAGVATVTVAAAAAARSVAGIAAVSCVALTKVVVRVAPFHLTVLPLTKPVPATVSVKAGPLTRALLGVRPVSVGAGLFTVNACAAEVPPPGAGVTTVTCGVPAVARSEAGIAAVSCVTLTKVVVRVAPFQRTLEPVTKLLPFRVRVKAAPPTLALEGESDVSDGAGAVIVNVWAPEVPPSTPGIVTVTWAVPTAAMSEAGIAAVTCVGLTRVVVRAPPFQRTLAPMSNPVPVSVSVNPAPPAVALEGDSAVSVGPPALTGRLSAADVPPPGAAVVTVTLATPATAVSVAGIAAVSCVALTNALPFRVRVKAAPPTLALEGESDVSVGAGLFTVNVCAADVPPPGAGVMTVTGTVAAVATSAAAIAAVSWVALTKVVVRAAPFQRTLEPLTKLLPFTVSVKAAAPTATLAGDSDEIVGAGLLIENVRAADVPPPGAGVTTVTEAVPVAAMSAAGIAAVSCVALTKVVVRAAPFHWTVAPFTKPLPVSVSVKPAPPTMALDGDSVVSVGAGLLIVKVCAAEVPPPGAGVTTVTDAVPVAATSAAGIAAVSLVALPTVGVG